jgi:hypothetical protein
MRLSSPVWPTNRLPITAVSLFSVTRGPCRVRTTSLLRNFMYIDYNFISDLGKTKQGRLSTSLFWPSQNLHLPCSLVEVSKFCLVHRIFKWSLDHSLRRDYWKQNSTWWWRHDLWCYGSMNGNLKASHGMCGDFCKYFEARSLFRYFAHRKMVPTRLQMPTC